MSDKPLHTHETDRDIEIFKQSDGHYEVHTSEGETYVGGTLNIAGRPAGMDADSELYLSGGGPEVTIAIYEDTRGEGNRLLAVSFNTEAGL